MPLAAGPAGLKAGPLVVACLCAALGALTGTSLAAQTRFHLPSFDPTDAPPALQAIEFETTGSPTFDLVLLELGRPGGWNGPVAVDGAGRVVWWHSTQGDIHGLALRRDGTLVLLDVVDGLLAIQPAGDTVATLPSTPDRRIHHAVIETSQGEVLFLARDARTEDGQEVVGEAIWRWDASSSATDRLWSSFDHLDWDDDRGPRSTPRNWLHANSLFEGPRGNLVVSLAFLNQVISISPDRTRLEWRIGGPSATHAVQGPAFAGQHQATEFEPGRVLLFDNHLTGSGLPVDSSTTSRTVEYRIDGSRAIPVWEFSSPDSLRSRVVGGAERLENGHTLVTFGAAAGLRGSTGGIVVYEVDREGGIVWTLRVKQGVRTLYRATAIAAPRDPPNPPEGGRRGR